MKIAAVALLIASTCAAYAQNTMSLGPGYRPDQRSARKLIYVLPKGWAADAAGAGKFGLYAVLVPKGKTLDNTDAVITVAFQLKDPRVPGLADLKSFVRTDLTNMLASSPSTTAARWQPRGLDPGRLPFLSYEFYGPPGSGVSSQHVVFLDAGDGYFSVSLTVQKRDALGSQDYEAFFGSLGLQ